MKFKQFKSILNLILCMSGMAEQPHRGGARAIGSGGQQDPDAVQPARLTSQEERSLSPRRRRIHSSSCSQQHLHTAGGNGRII